MLEKIPLVKFSLKITTGKFSAGAGCAARRQPERCAAMALRSDSSSGNSSRQAAPDDGMAAFVSSLSLMLPSRRGGGGGGALFAWKSILPGVNLSQCRQLSHFASVI